MKCGELEATSFSTSKCPKNKRLSLVITAKSKRENAMGICHAALALTHEN
jgi:hypothetical protein